MQHPRLSVPHTRDSLYLNIRPLVAADASLVRLSDACVINGYHVARTETARAAWRATVDRCNAPGAWCYFVHVPVAHRVATYIDKNCTALGVPSFSVFSPSYNGTHVIIHAKLVEQCVQVLLREIDVVLRDEWVFVAP